MNTAEIIQLVTTRIPYPDQMRELDISSEDEFRFTWRGTRFRVSDSLRVESFNDGFLYGCNESILLQALLNQP